MVTSTRGAQTENAATDRKVTAIPAAVCFCALERLRIISAPPLHPGEFTIDTRTHWVIHCSWLAYAVLAVVAACQWHGLYADGAFVLVSLISDEAPRLHHSGRVVSQFLQQTPALLALHVGFDSLSALTTVYGLTLHALPWGLSLGATLLVPSEHAGYRLFPWLGFFAGTLGAAFALIAEGPMTTGLFWVVLVTILFRAHSTGGRIGLLVAALPMMWMHEVLVFLAPLLALAASFRALREAKSSSRLFFRALALWFLAVAVYQFMHVVAPVSVANRGSFIAGLLGFRWLFSPHAGHGVNFPLLLGSIAVGIVCANGAAIWLPFLRRWRIPDTAVLSLMFALAAMAVLGPLSGISAIEPSTQFSARNHPAFLSFALAMLMLMLWRKGIADSPIAGWMRPALLAALLTGSLGWHAIAQHEWSHAITAWRDMLQRTQGLVPWTDALVTVTPRQRALLWTYSWGWTNPAMSLLLAPSGRVQAVVKNWADPAATFFFDAGASSTIPISRWWDLSPYTAARTPSLSRDE